MTEQNNNEAMDKAMLVNLVMMLSTGAMQQLGKIVDPETNKAEINLEAARVSIDMLAMIQRKTEGNLDDEERKLIDNTLASLQMNYVETARGAGEGADEEQPAEGEPRAEKEPGQEAGAEEKQVVQPEGGEDHNDPKFHKSYG